MIAFTGRRDDQEVDIHYVWLRKSDGETVSRQRKIEEAIKKMKKGRKAAPKKKEEPKKKEAEAKPKMEVTIDFENLHRRVRRISIENSTERRLFWSHDSKRLAFSSTINGKSGTYVVDFPVPKKPVLLSSQTGSNARWLKSGNRIVWLADGVPSNLDAGSKAVSKLAFGARREIDPVAYRRAAFLQAWRVMRDSYYDERLGNRDWNAIRKKYEDMAAHVPDHASPSTSLMIRVIQ